MNMEHVWYLSVHDLPWAEEIPQGSGVGADPHKAPGPVSWMHNRCPTQKVGGN